MRESGAIAHMPAGMSFEEAAAVCDGACIALSCLRRRELGEGTQHPRLRRLRLGRHRGRAARQGTSAPTSRPCATRRTLELVRSLGADEVIDYTQEDFTKNGETYDVIFDAVGKHSFRRCRGSLKPGGVFIATDLGSCGTSRYSRCRRGDRRQAGHVRHREVQEGGRPLPQAADRGRRVPGGHRPHVSARGRGRGDEYVETGQKTGNVVLTVG